MVPGLGRVAVLWNPTNPWHPTAVKDLEAASRQLGIDLSLLGVGDASDIEAAFAGVGRIRAGAVLVLSDPLTFAQRSQVAELAAKHRLPMMSGLIQYTEAGGLLSYWPDSVAMFHRAASYVHRILSGSQPGDLPIEQPTKFVLAINLKTAQRLGLTVPASLRLRADRLID